MQENNDIIYDTRKDFFKENHSDDCNAKFYYTKAGDLIMLAIKNIDANEEILVNYREHSLEKAYYV